MSDEKAVLSAIYTDYKRIPSRGVLQLIFEVPIEMEGHVHALIGVPGSPGKGRYFALAALTKPPGAKRPSEAKGDSLTREIAILCKAPAFQEFIAERGSPDSAEYVRRWCKVESRAQIVLGSEAAKRWYKLDEAFGEWADKKAEKQP